MLKAITAYSRMVCSKDVADELIRQANLQLGVYRPQVGILYASCPHDHQRFSEIINNLCSSFPGLQLLGGTVVGGFTGDSGYCQDGFFLCLLLSDTITLNIGCVKNISEHLASGNFVETFHNHIEESSPNQVPAACMFLSPYYEIDGNRLIEGVQEALPQGCLTFGGMTTDYWSQHDLNSFPEKIPPHEHTILFFAKDGCIDVGDDTLVFLLFAGDIEVKTSTSYGWSDIGMVYPGRAEGSVLTEIDGKKTHTFLSELQHPLASAEYDNVEYPLWFHVSGKEPFLRDIFFDRETGLFYSKCATLPSSFDVSFSFPTKEKVLKEFKRCLSTLAGPNTLVLVTTCCTHLGVLGAEVHQEHDSLLKAFPKTPILGGYVFGEFGPTVSNRESILHSCSSIIISIQESAEESRENQEHYSNFLSEMIREQRREIDSLKKQLRFFESSKSNKMRQLSEDCLGILLCRSHKSLTSHAEQISELLKVYYAKKGMRPPFGISRNRLIDHLVSVKNRAENMSGISD